MDWLSSAFYFIVSLGAAIAGAVGGVGSGIIVKPILELVTDMAVYGVNLLSSLAVFFMAAAAVVRQRKNVFDREDGVRFEVAVPIAIGSALGGIFGNLLFAGIRDILAVAQGWGTIALVGILLLHQIFESKFKPMNFKGVPTFLILGLVLGAIAAFLGIGGGPLNLSALNYFTGMPLKTAALYSIFIIMFAQGASLLNWAIPTFWNTGTWPLAGTERGYVTIYIMLAVIIGSIIGAFIGASWYGRLKNHPKGNSVLKIVYCVILIFVMLVSVWNLFMYVTA